MSVLCFLWPSPKELALTISQIIGVGHMEGRHQEATKDKNNLPKSTLKKQFFKAFVLAIPRTRGGRGMDTNY